MPLRLALFLIGAAMVAPQGGVEIALADEVTEQVTRGNKRLNQRVRGRRGRRVPPQRRAIQRARSQFALGVRQAERRRYWEAIRAFRRARRLHDTPAIRYNLALALVEVDRPVDAYRIVRVLAREPGVSAMLRASAFELERELRRELVFVQVNLPRGAETIRLNSRVLQSDTLALSPGRHTLEALDGRRLVARQTLDLPAGTRATIPLKGIEYDREPDPRPRRRRIIAVVAAAVAAVAGGAVAISVAR